MQAGPHSPAVKMPHMVQDSASPGQMLPGDTNIINLQKYLATMLQLTKSLAAHPGLGTLGRRATLVHGAAPGSAQSLAHLNTQGLVPADTGEKYVLLGDYYKWYLTIYLLPAQRRGDCRCSWCCGWCSPSCSSGSPKNI